MSSKFFSFGGLLTKAPEPIEYEDNLIGDIMLSTSNNESIEEKIPGKIWGRFCEGLPVIPGNGEIWSDGCEIMCKTLTLCDAIYEALTRLGLDNLTTGYYDPDEDLRDNIFDLYTGWYYITCQ